MKFKINWHIPEDEWKRSTEVRQKEPPGSEYDKACGPHYDLLYGEIQVSYELSSLFPSPQNLSLADLAYGLHYGIVREGFKEAQEGSSIKFQQADDALEISFKKSGGKVLMITNHPSSKELEVPEDDFFHGVRQFLMTFSQELMRRAPELLDWESLSVLRKYLNATQLEF